MILMTEDSIMTTKISVESCSSNPEPDEPESRYESQSTSFTVSKLCTKV